MGVGCKLTVGTLFGQCMLVIMTMQVTIATRSPHTAIVSNVTTGTNT